MKNFIQKNNDTATRRTVVLRGATALLLIAATVFGTTATFSSVTADTEPLSVAISADKEETKPGNEITYTTVIKNISDTKQEKVVMRGQFVGDADYVAGSGTYVHSETGNVLPLPDKWTDEGANFGYILSGEKVTITYKTRVNSGAEDLSHAQVTANARTESHRSWIRDTANTLIVHEDPQYKIKADQYADRTEVSPGDVINYTIRVDNKGNRVFHNLYVVEYLPNKDNKLTEYVSGSGKTIVGSSEKSLDDNWVEDGVRLDHLNPGQSFFIKFKARVKDNAPNGQVLWSVANVKADETPDWIQCAAESVVDKKNPVLQIEKNVSPAFVNPGETANYTVTVRNVGEGTAVNTKVNDDLPEGFTYTETGENTRQWDLGNLTSGNSKTLLYEVEVGEDVEAGVYPNTAVASADNHGNVSDTATLEVRSGDVEGEEFFPVLDIEKTANKTFTNPGTQVTYTITVTNTGEADAVNTVVTDTLPDGFTVNGQSTITWNAGTLEKNGGTWTKSYIVDVAPGVLAGNYTNTAVATADNFPKEVADDYTIEVRTGAVLGETGIPGGMMSVLWGAVGLIMAGAGYLFINKRREELALARI